MSPSLKVKHFPQCDPHGANLFAKPVSISLTAIYEFSIFFICGINSSYHSKEA